MFVFLLSLLPSPLSAKIQSGDVTELFQVKREVFLENYVNEIVMRRLLASNIRYSYHGSIAFL